MSKRRLVFSLTLLLSLLGLVQPDAARAEKPSDDPDRPLISCQLSQTPIPLLDDDGASPARLAAYAGGINGRFGPTLFMTDSANHVLYAVSSGDIDSIAVDLLAGAPGTVGFQDGNGSDARFRKPKGVAVDEQGNIYVADYGNLAVRKIAPNGDVITIAGSGIKGSDDAPIGRQATFKGPNGLAYGRLRGAPTLFITDNRNNLLRTIDLSDPNYPVSTLALDVSFDLPTHIDWWAESEPVFDKEGILIGWRPRDRGYLFVTDRNGIYRVAENEDGRLTVDQAQIAGRTKARSIYSDDTLSLWIVPEDRSTIEMIEFLGPNLGYAEQPTPQRLCSEEIQNPQTVILLYGGIVFTDGQGGNNKAALIMGAVGNSPTNIRSAPSTIGPRY